MSASEDPRREVIRQLLYKRYNGMIPVTDEMIDAVLAELDELTTGKTTGPKNNLAIQEVTMPRPWQKPWPP